MRWTRVVSSGRWSGAVSDVLIVFLSKLEKDVLSTIPAKTLGNFKGFLSIFANNSV